MKIRMAVAALSLSAAAFVGILNRENYTDTAIIPTKGDVPTVGFGTTGGVKMGDTTTPVKAVNRAMKDVAEYEGAIKRCVKSPLSQTEYDIYVDLSYNIGPTAFCTSTIVKRLNATDYKGACDAILPDSTPDAFSFAPVTGAEISTDYTRTMTVSGIDVPASISIVGGQYKIGAGSYTSSAGTVSDGEVVTVKLTSGTAENETASLTLSIGGVDGEFTVTNASSAVLIGQLIITESSVPNGSGVGSFGFGVNAGATLTVGTDGNGKYLRGHYDANLVGDNYIWGGCQVSETGEREAYVKCRARMPNIKHGLKFIKMFGIRVGANYANSTFAFDYTGDDNGSMICAAWGDGSDETNDVQSVLKFDGTHPEYVGRAYPDVILETPQNSIWSKDNWGTEVHDFRIMFRHNTGDSAETEVANGALEVWIDDVLYAKAENIFTRHHTNGMIESVGFFGATQNNTSAFEFDIFEGATVSTGGWI